MSDRKALPSNSNGLQRVTFLEVNLLNQHTCGHFGTHKQTTRQISFLTAEIVELLYQNLHNHTCRSGWRM
jgi:hypothetical protein